jgi:glycerol-3-phosphate cytidylyltransferase/D-beta-D-heptose 7-phosphate kinase/D-beta-D-heptose 1-phosphate adenosyltransferase
MERPTATIVSGFFSPLHAGHLDMIEAAASHGEMLIVIVNNNDQQLAKKGKLIMDEQDRLRIVRSLRMVDDALIAVDDDNTVSSTLRLLAGKYPGHRLVFANGGDRDSDKVVPEAAVCSELGISMIFDMGGAVKADSSTRINTALGIEGAAGA